MSYITQDDLKGLIPAEFLRQALDDDSDGEADSGIWEALESGVEAEIDGKLGQKYAVPFASPIPSVVKAAAMALALWSLYQRRGMSGENNPWETQAKEVRAKLDRIGNGDEPLTPGTLGQETGGVVIAEDSKLYVSSGNLLV